MNELIYSIKDLRKVESYLCHTMAYSEFCEYFHSTTKKHWGYFENILSWIEENPRKVKQIIGMEIEKLKEQEAKQ